MRVSHVIKRNKTNETVRQAIWFDTETDPKQVGKDAISHWLRFGWGAYRLNDARSGWGKPDWFRFESVTAFWDWVESKVRPRTKLWLFCHNTNFDLAILDTFAQLPARGWKLRIGIIEGPPTILSYRKESSTIVILDTLNFWRVPLSELGHSLGVEKLPMPAPDASRQEWDIYGQRDVEVIMEACLKWWRFLIENDFGGFSCTLASQSMRTFRHKYMRHEIFVDCNKDALELSRRSYHGGRCDCFFIGKKQEPCYLLDVNSMYPYVMASYPVPIRLRSHIRRCTTSDVYEWCKNHCVIASCDVKINEPSLPLMVHNKLIFPVGRFSTCLTTRELQWCFSNGSIERIRECAVYYSAIVFDEFVKDIYARRMDALHHGDMVSVEFFKRLLNSHYGKWGQKGRQWENVSTTTEVKPRRWVEIDYDTHSLVQLRSFSGVVQRLLTDGESLNSFPAIAAHITANARLTLWDYIMTAGRENVYYCDTDSLLVNEHGFSDLKTLIDPERLGALKLEGYFNRIVIYGPKDYEFDSQVKIKGIRKNAILTPEGDYIQEKWSSLRGMLRQGQLEAPLTRRIHKFLRREYDKGMITPTGYVRPYLLSGSDVDFTTGVVSSGSK